MSTTEVLIIGAGSAGAAAALHCARRGLEVLCIDRRRLDEAGARWVNGIPSWTFDAAQISRPRREELLGEPARLHLVAGYGPERVVVDHHDLLEIDMRHLVLRLQAEARASGARLLGEVMVQGRQGHVVQTSTGAIRARHIVDASGIGGLGWLEAPGVRREDICAAAQEVRQVVDLEQGRRFFERFGVRWGETLCFTGVAGGYSVINLRGCGDRLNILTGSIPGLGHRGGRGLLKDFLSSHRWIGARIFGGAAPIPLRRPYDRLAEGDLAVIGDAACQVFPAHGSGVGAGLLAARELAEALSRGEGAEGYALRWHRRYGGLFAAYDLFRRFSSRLNADELARMMRSGLLDGEVAAVGLCQRAPSPWAIKRLRRQALVEAPDLILAMGGVVGRMALATAFYKRFPRQVERRQAWSRKVAALFGMPSDFDLMAYPGR